MISSMSSVALRSMPEHERPRERLVRGGVGTLSDAELVAIQLGSGSRGESALELAQTLLTEYGGAAGLARADVSELARQCGVGVAKACRLVSAFALADRAPGPVDGQVIAESADIARVAARLIGRERNEHVLVVVLDGRNRVRRVEPLAHGGATAASLPIRDALAVTLRHDGVAFALAHNHPGGDPTPSQADVTITRQVAFAAEQVGLRLLDHVVVAGSSWRSVIAAS